MDVFIASHLSKIYLFLLFVIFIRIFQKNKNKKNTAINTRTKLQTKINNANSNNIIKKITKEKNNPPKDFSLYNVAH